MESKYSPEEENLKHKKEQERRDLRQAQWEKDPDLFIHQDDVVFGAIETGNGIGILCGGHARPKIEIALTRLNYKANMMFQHMDLQMAMKAKEAEAGIITPGDGKIIV